MKVCLYFCSEFFILVWSKITSERDEREASIEEGWGCLSTCVIGSDLGSGWPAGGSVHCLSAWHFWPHCCSDWMVRWNPKYSLSDLKGTGDELYPGVTVEKKLLEGEKGRKSGWGRIERPLLSSPFSSHSALFRLLTQPTLLWLLTACRVGTKVCHGDFK